MVVKGLTSLCLARPCHSLSLSLGLCECVYTCQPENSHAREVIQVISLSSQQVTECIIRFTYKNRQERSGVGVNGAPFSVDLLKGRHAYCDANCTLQVSL